MIDAVADQLEADETFLFLDNFDPFQAAAPVVADLLQRAPRLRMLVTIRARLRIHSENEMSVSPPRLASEPPPGWHPLPLR
jgi:hypothetical protein